MAGSVTWRTFVPAVIRRCLRPARRAYRLAASWPVDLGDLRRVTPIDPLFGFQRGTPIDRVYVDSFIGGHAADIRGHVLEIGAPEYTHRFGAGVEKVDILMVTEGNSQATIVADLTAAPQIPDDTFDCAVLTQTLQFIYDVRAALATLHRVLVPGGVLLATVPGLTKISQKDDEQWGEWWHYTSRSAKRLAEEAFGEGFVEIQSYGNVLSASAFLYGLASLDLRPEELQARDPLYEVTIGLRAVKPTD